MTQPVPQPVPHQKLLEQFTEQLHDEDPLVALRAVVEITEFATRLRELVDFAVTVFGGELRRAAG